MKWTEQVCHGSMVRLVLGRGIYPSGDHGRVMQANANWTTSAESPVDFGLTGGEGMSQDEVGSVFINESL